MVYFRLKKRETKGMVTRSLYERRQRLLGCVFQTRDGLLQMRLSSFDSRLVRFVAVADGTILTNATITWVEFARLLGAGAVTEYPWAR